jgi:hypothetical protein
VAERDWERPETVRDVFDILVRHGTIDAFVADVLTDAEREMDHGGPGTVPDDAQVQACLDPTYMACVERFLYATGAAS